MKFVASDSKFFDGITGLDIHSSSPVEFVQYEVPRENWTPKSIIVGDKLDALALCSNLLQGPSKHMLQMNKTFISEDLVTTAAIVEDPQKYFEQRSKALVLNAKVSLKICFSSPDDKTRLRQETSKFLEQVPGVSVTESAEAIIEELYMNSIYDAPREAKVFNMDPKTYGSDGDAVLELTLSDSRLVITCADPYGSLDIRKCLLRMADVYQKGVSDSILYCDGMGAGIGLVLMFEHSSSLYLGVIPGRKTVVSAIIPVGMNNRQRAAVKKSLHLISL